MRTTISIDDNVAELGGKIAARDFRGNFSHLCEKALKEFCTAHERSPSQQEIDAAVKEVGGEEVALAALRALKRTKKRAA